MASKANKSPRRGHLSDDRVLVDWLADLAAHPGQEREILERRAQAEAQCSWPELYATSGAEFVAELNFGSANLRAVWSCCALFHPETRAAGIASWGRAQELERTRGFELEEPGSRIYKLWSMLARLQGLRSGVLTEYFREWLLLYWTLERLSLIETPVGPRSLRCGARSQGQFARIKADYACAIAFARRWQFVKGVDQSWSKDPEIRALDSLRAEITSTAEPVRSLGENWTAILARAPRWPVLSHTWYLRTSAGLAVWIDNPEAGEGANDSVNSNTPSIAGMGVNEPGGAVWSLPPPSRDHVRQKTVTMAVTTILDGDRPVRLRFVQGGAGRQMDIIQDLPGGDIAYLIRHGHSGPVMVTGQTTSSTPVAGPVIPPQVDNRAAAVQLLRSVSLATKNRARRDAIADALERGEDPAVFLDTLRSWYLPDSQQLSAKQIREVLSLLEEDT